MFTTCNVCQKLKDLKRCDECAAGRTGMVSLVVIMGLCRRKKIAVGWIEIMSSVVITRLHKSKNSLINIIPLDEKLAFERLDPYRK